MQYPYKLGLKSLFPKRKLHFFNRQLENYRGPSFETISCVGPHAAITHFSPTPETATQITRDEIYLVDSGGQYWYVSYLCYLVLVRPAC